MKGNARYGEGAGSGQRILHAVTCRSSRSDCARTRWRRLICTASPKYLENTERL